MRKVKDPSLIAREGCSALSRRGSLIACLAEAEGGCSSVPDHELDVAHLRHQPCVLSAPPQQPRQPLHGHHMLPAPACCVHQNCPGVEDSSSEGFRSALSAEPTSCRSLNLNCQSAESTQPCQPLHGHHMFPGPEQYAYTPNTLDDGACKKLIHVVQLSGKHLCSVELDTSARQRDPLCAQRSCECCRGRIERACTAYSRDQATAGQKVKSPL